MTQSLTPLRIGTRGSLLALAQARQTRARLIAAHPTLAAPGAIEIIVIRTTGDAITDRTLSAVGGKGLFTKEIEQALIDGSIDLAVHSMKDVPTVLPDGLIVDVFLPREDPRDGFFCHKATCLEELPPGAVVGTASLRRQAQILFLRPDLKIVPIRGNVDTRLKKLADGVVDATLLAVAGLHRLEIADKITAPISIDTMLPAVAQGAIGIERRIDDARVAAYLAPLNNPDVAVCVNAERALLAVLDGSCKTPIAALATLDSTGSQLTLTGMIIRPDGTERHLSVHQGPSEEAVAIGERAGHALRAKAGPGFFDLPIPDALPV